MKLSLLSLILLPGVSGFAPGPVAANRPMQQLNAENAGFSIETMVDDAKKGFALRYSIYEKSQAEGANFKQIVANVMAGEYDQDAAKAKVEELSKSAPCVMFTWEASPSCKSAIKAMDQTGYDYTIVRLDDPWSEGNPLRAEIGKMVGKTSVPAVFIGGEYVGGFDDGVSDQAPGLVALAFQGTLQEKLAAVGAAKK